MDQTFIDAVKKHDLTRVRMMLSNELLFDSSGNSFKSLLNFAEEYLEDLFEIDLPLVTVVPEDDALWNMDLISKFKLELNSNFTKKKLDLYKDLCRKVVAPPSAKQSTNHKAPQDRQKAPKETEVTRISTPKNIKQKISDRFSCETTSKSNEHEDSDCHPYVVSEDFIKSLLSRIEQLESEVKEIKHKIS